MDNHKTNGRPIKGRAQIMTNEEILKAVDQVEVFGGMTVNERLFVSGLLEEFDKSKIHDKNKAMYILELLQVDRFLLIKFYGHSTVCQPKQPISDTLLFKPTGYSRRRKDKTKPVLTNHSVYE